MSPPLSHPFRSAPTSGVAQTSYDQGAKLQASSESQPSQNSNPNTAEGDSYYSPEEVEQRAQRKLKLIGGGVAVVLLYSILSTAIGDLSEIFFPSSERRARAHAALDPEDEPHRPQHDRELLALREERARAADKVGWFDALFCSGRRHSTFCD